MIIDVPQAHSIISAMKYLAKKNKDKYVLKSKYFEPVGHTFYMNGRPMASLKYDTGSKNFEYEEN